MIATFERTIVGCNMLRAFGHPVATCCDRPNQCACSGATRWPNSRNMLPPIMTRYVALRGCYRLARASNWNWSNFSCKIRGCCMMLWSFGQVCATMLHPGVFNTQHVATLYNRVAIRAQHIAIHLCWNVAIVWLELANVGRNNTGSSFQNFRRAPLSWLMWDSPGRDHPLILLSLRSFSLQRFLVWLTASTIVKPRPNGSTQHIPTLLAQHLQFRPNDRNIWTQQIATLLGATYCARLAIVLQHVATGRELKMELVRIPRRNIAAWTWPNNWHIKNLTIFKFQPTTPNMSQHVATGWPNARKVLHPTMSRYVSLKCCDRLAGN